VNTKTTIITGASSGLGLECARALLAGDPSWHIVLAVRDIGRGTEAVEQLGEPQRCAVMLEGMQPIDELLRSSGQYGPKVEVPDDADVQTRLLAFIGRDPR